MFIEISLIRSYAVLYRNWYDLFWDLSMVFKTPLFVFHGLETVFVAFESIWACHTPLIYHIREKMHFLKVKADQLTHTESQGWSAVSVWRSRLSMPQPLIYHIWKKMDIRKVIRLISRPYLPVCPVPSVWSQIWK